MRVLGYNCLLHKLFLPNFSLDNAFENQNISTNSCLLAGQQFQAGSSWHPYLPPNGFDTCTLCHCNVSNSKKFKNLLLIILSI